MPKLTRYFVKSALINFVLAFLLAVFVQAAPWIAPPPVGAYLNPVYFHLFMVGWITQMIMGVSWWMFPPYAKDNPRGSETLGWASFVSINAGLLLRAIGEPMMYMDPVHDWKYMLVFSSVLQWLSGIFYVSNIWKRVRGK